MRALLLSHGNLAAALLEGARLICALEANMEAMSNQGLGRDELRAAIQDWVEETPGPALILVDAGGGSCGIAARLAVRGREDIRILGGANLPMVLCYMSSHGDLELDELVAKLISRGRADVDNLGGGALG